MDSERPRLSVSSRAVYRSMIRRSLESLEADGRPTDPHLMTAADIRWLADGGYIGGGDSLQPARTTFEWAAWCTRGRSGLSEEWTVIGQSVRFPYRLERSLADWRESLAATGLADRTVQCKSSRVRRTLWAMHSEGMDTDPSRMSDEAIDEAASLQRVADKTRALICEDMRQWVDWCAAEGS